MIKRYFASTHSYTQMPTGQFVLYADYVKRVKELEAENKRLKATCESAIATVETYNEIIKEQENERP